MKNFKLLGTFLTAVAIVMGSAFLVSHSSFAKDGQNNQNSNTVESNDNTNDDNSNSGDQVKGKGEQNDQNENEVDDQDGLNTPCTNTLVNGHLYKVGTDATVYLASHCELKPFRGEAAFKARGLKFQNIITFDSLPTGVTISQMPALPAEGTLVKGSDKTVWFVNHNGKRQGFTSADVFNNLGFKFGQVQQISDSDLGTIQTDTNISDGSHHPDGSVIKCGNSAAVFVVIGGEKFPFANLSAFETRGHSFDHILNVDCGRFQYVQGPTITK